MGGPGASVSPGAGGGAGQGPRPKRTDTGFELLLDIPTPLVAYLTSTLAGIGFFFVLARRRLEEPSDGLLASVDADAAVKLATAHVPSLEPESAGASGEADAGSDAPDTDARLPRWLRPSLHEARLGRNPDRLSGRD